MKDKPQPEQPEQPERTIALMLTEDEALLVKQALTIDRVATQPVLRMTTGVETEDRELVCGLLIGRINIELRRLKLESAPPTKT